MKNKIYTQEELKEISDMIVGKRRLSTQEIDTLRKEFQNKQISDYLYPFIRLFATNSDLYKKISEDEKAKKYSLFCFFPETFFENGNRGPIGIIKHPKKQIVIKPIQNSRELEVAQIADKLGIGPKQHKSLDGFLTEEFIEGDLFSRLKEDKTSIDSMYNLGRRMGEILTKLHSNEIYYNDTILTDDFGRSHVIVPETSPAILFDYGVALRLDKHPNLTDEEVYNFARTLPMVGMFLESQPSQEKIQSLVQEYLPKLQITTKEQIVNRDIDFLNEGLMFAKYRLGNHIAEPFLDGFKETYN